MGGIGGVYGLLRVDFANESLFPQTYTQGRMIFILSVGVHRCA
jgi:hypothetical protein